MLREYISYEELPNWVPGRVLLASDGLGWKNVACRAYHYAGQDVIVPQMKDFMLVGYRGGVTPMQRRFDGRWTKETLVPGAASLLTRAQQVSWNWKEPIDAAYVKVGKVAEGERVRGNARNTSRDQCELIMMIGLPGSGKTTWVEKHVAENPDKQYNVVGVNTMINKMTVSGINITL